MLSDPPKPLKSPQQRADAYLICKQRGHAPDFGAYISGKEKCLWCGTIYWTEEVLHEENIPAPRRATRKAGDDN